MNTYRVVTVRESEAVSYCVGHVWADRYLADLAVFRRPNTVRGYAFDLARWLNYCVREDIESLDIQPRHVLRFVKAERQGITRVSDRTISRRLSAIRQWYGYLMLHADATGVADNPIPSSGTIGTALGTRLRRPAFLRYDRPLPHVLSGEEVARFLEHLTVTGYRDRAIVYLMWHSGLRISEALALRLEDIEWGNSMILVRVSKSCTHRRIPISQETESLLANYIRLERPKDLDHDRVFVCLGRRNYGQPMTYRAWVYICEKARQAAGLLHVHAHAFRHTCATNLAEGGMPLDAVQRQLGHSCLESTMIYNDVRSRRLAQEYRRVMEGANG